MINKEWLRIQLPLLHRLCLKHDAYGNERWRERERERVSMKERDREGVENAKNGIKGTVCWFENHTH